MPYTVIFDSEMPKKNPFKVESEFGEAISVSWGNANHALDLIENAIEEGGCTIEDIENILLHRYDR